MPIYEYRCEACAEISEVIQKISDPKPSSCPKCNEGPLEKVLSMSAFHLKGGGWYDDAYSSKKPKDTAKSDTKGDTKKDSAKKDSTTSSSEKKTSTSESSSKPSKA